MLWITYRGIDATSGWLTLPIVIWSAFSMVLNAAIWRLNG
jgi:tryptophan-rich sensory protein